MQTWQVSTNNNPYRKTEGITGENLQEAVKENLTKIAYNNKSDNYQIIKILDHKIEWSDGIFGGTGGIKLKIFAKVSNTQLPGSSKYEEYTKEIEVWIYANKEDVYADVNKNIKQLREMSGMNRKDFSEYFDISQRTLENWENERNTPPDYLVSLIEYKLKKEGLIK